MTQTTGDGTPPLGVCAKRRRKEARAMNMNMKERLKIHREIVRENARKLREWKKKGGRAA